MKASFLVSVMCAALFAFYCPAAVEGADPVTGKECAECHPGILAGKVLHQPVKKNECESCHKSGGGDHRLKKGLYAPKAPAAKLCYQCHKNLSSGISVHGPIKEGVCSGCHAPHYSSDEKLLRGKGNDFCLRCHGKMSASDKLGHAPVKTGKCGVCHLPHQSSEKSLLKPSETGICLSCHNKSLATGVSVHKPVASRQCSGCHVTHGSIPKLLKIPGAFPEKNAQFCYLCHASLGTKKSVHGPIRNGDCGGCHVPHSSPYKKLLRGDGSAFCFSCHDNREFTKPSGHEPVKSGRCMDCHTPHQSDKAKLIKETAGLICYECHNKAIGVGKSVHKPVAAGRCGDCHLVHSADSRKLLRPSPLLDGKTVSFCYNCHKNLAVERTVHAPVKQGKCADCHSVHSSPASKLLKADGSGLCFGCHQRAPFVKKFPHEPVAAGACTSCHLPHQSTTPKLLKSTGGAIVCYECHDRKLAVGASVHKPVATGECGKCHAVHGGDYRKLLLGQFTDHLQVPFDEANYAFCFNCHEGSAFADTKAQGTGFRNGKINLHSKHVRGHSCKVCHDFHAAPQPKLLRERIRGADGYTYTMKFTPSSTGGSCTTSCHLSESYSR